MYHRLQNSFQRIPRNICLTPLCDLQIYEKVKNGNVALGKMKKQTVAEIWKKRSIFF